MTLTSSLPCLFPVEEASKSVSKHIPPHLNSIWGLKVLLCCYMREPIVKEKLYTNVKKDDYEAFTYFIFNIWPPLGFKGQGGETLVEADDIKRFIDVIYDFDHESFEKWRQ